MIQGCLQSMRWADSQTDKNKCLHVGDDTQHKALGNIYAHGHTNRGNSRKISRENWRIEEIKHTHKHTLLNTTEKFQNPKVKRLF